MTLNYENICKRLQSIGYSMIDSYEAYTFSLFDNETARFKFLCDKNHENNNSLAVFNNNFSNYNLKKISSVCTTCRKEIKKSDTFQTHYNKILLKTGHKLISMEKYSDCVFYCGNCNKKSKTSYYRVSTYKNCNNCIKTNNLIKIDPEICRCVDEKCEKFHLKKFPNCYDKFLDLMNKSEIFKNIVVNYRENSDLLIEVEREINREYTEKIIKDILSEFNYNKQTKTFIGCNCSKIHTTICKLDKYSRICKARDFQLLTIENNYIDDKKILIKCICGTERYKNLNDIIKGTRCVKNICKSQKCKAFNLVNHGCINTFQRPETKEKIVNTNREKLGVDYPQQNKEVKAKTNKTNIERYGFNYAFNTPETYEKIRTTHTINHGCPYPLQSKLIQEKADKSILEIYNVDKPLLSYNRKQYTLPSGKIVNVQGYENIVLDYLLKEDHIVFNRPIKEIELILGNDIRKFKYTDHTGKNRIYYPDISIRINGNFIIQENYDTYWSHYLDLYEYIEVKSVYTYNRDPKTNYEKWKTVAMTGNFIRIFIYTNKKELWDIWSFYPMMKYPIESLNNKVTQFDIEINLD